MNPYKKVKRVVFMPIVAVSFFLSLAIPAQATETDSHSYSLGSGEIRLSWNHDLQTPRVLVFSSVSTNAEVYEEGTAIAIAEATSLFDSDAGIADWGESVVSVEFNSDALGLKALAESNAIAQSIFTLRNDTEHKVDVYFDLTSNYAYEGAILDPESDRAEASLYLTLHRENVAGLNVRKIAKRMINRINERRRDRRVFTTDISVKVPAGFYFSDSDSLSESFTVRFSPGETHLFILSVEGNGLATVSLEGCSPEYWNSHRENWYLDPETKFFDVFGVGQEQVTLLTALKGVNLDRRNGMAGLMGHAVAALLNTASPDVSYFVDENSLKELVNTAFESEDFQTTRDRLEYHNNLGAPSFCK